jgi:hypothetical protein
MVAQDSVVAVVVIVVFGPVPVWDKSQKTTGGTNEVIGPLGRRERLVAAIMLNDKNPDQKECIDHGQSNGKPDGHVAPNIHRNPNGDKRQERIEYLYGCFSSVG